MTRTNDVFISYKREERDKAFIIAEALTERGYKVWWDIELLPGSSFVSEISAIIEKSKVVIVLWSKASVESDFVLGEAELARKKGTIVPARLDDCEIPLQFSNYHTLDLSAWTSGADRTQLGPLLKAVEERIAPSEDLPESVEATDIALHKPEIEALFWREVASAKHQSIKEYQTYLQKFGNDGIFSDLARIRVDQLVLQKKFSNRFSLSKGAKVTTAVVVLLTGVFGVILKGSEVLEIFDPIFGSGVSSTSESSEVPVPVRPPDPEGRTPTGGGEFRPRKYPAEPIKYRCSTIVSGVEVRIVGTKGDKIEINDLINDLFYQAYPETLEEMGGKSGELTCGDVYSNNSIIVVRTGWKNDYVQIYGTRRETDGKLKLTQYRWLPRDGSINVKFSSNQQMPSVQLLNGRNRDRYYQVCWSVSDGFYHSVYANQFTGGWKDCNQILPKSDLHRELMLSR